MNIQLFLLCLIFILALAFICQRVNWKNETQDLLNLFTKKRRDTTKEF